MNADKNSKAILKSSDITEVFTFQDKAVLLTQTLAMGLKTQDSRGESSRGKCVLIREIISISDLIN